MADEREGFTWSGPKSTWTQQEWENYRSMPRWLQLPVDLFSIVATAIRRIRPPRGGDRPRG